MRLRDLAGQDHAIGLLLRGVSAKRVPHAYLFEGPPGVGKRTAALGLALALICPEAPGEGCGACDVCRRALAGNHPDVRVIAAATSQILIEQAQEVVTLACGRPHEAPARVIVLDEADRLNPNAANCLLKTLEEPFPGTHLVLVTCAPDRLLPTIRSRAQRVRFVPIPAATLVEIAVKRGADKRRAETAAAIAGGAVARMFELLDASVDDGLWNAVDELRRTASRMDMGSVFDTAAALGDKEGKATLPEVLSLLARLYRDALAAAAGANEIVLLRERQQELETLAARARLHHGLAPLRHALGAVLEAEEALGANVNAVTALERMLVEVRCCEREVQP